MQRSSGGEDLAAWIGRRQDTRDTLDVARSNALSRALGRDGNLGEGAALPLLHHWLYFWDVQPPSGLGRDGHPAKGGFLPPVALPRRMWAGGELTFRKPLVLGSTVTRTSTIVAVEEKHGRSGLLVFVTVHHELAGDDGVAISEMQHLVYREPAAAAVAAPVAGPAPSAPWQEEVNPDATLLFRYSALTMNGHRIHYDRPYAVNEEGYPGLVVHGPLQATLLIDLAARRLGAPITGFAYRGQQPAFDGLPLFVCGAPTGTGADVWTQQGSAKSIVATVRTDAAATA